MPVTYDDVLKAAKALNFEIPKGHEEDYLTLLKNTEKASKIIMDFDDYAPFTDTERFPRKDISFPQNSEDNPYRAWAYKVTIQDTNPDSKGLLYNRTVCLKDTICVKDVPQLFGTSAIEDFIPVSDATVVTRVLENGGIIVGKGMCENFSHGATSFSNPWGPVENPYAPGFTTGGSSSGCGALIASGTVEMGVGGDQGGSIRIPAAFCGIVGHKPTFGLVPYTGVLSSEPAVDTVGPMAQTVLDAALLLQATAGYDNIDDRQLGAPLPENVPKYRDLVLAARGKSLAGVRIGILKEGFETETLDPNVGTLVREAAQRYTQLGATVEEVSLPLHLMISSLGHVINKFGSSQTRQGRQVGHKQYHVNEYWEKLLPWTQDKYDKAKYFVTGTSMSAEYGWRNFPTAYGKAINISRRYRDEILKLHETYDVIVMPTLPQPARRHEKPGAGPVAWNTANPGATFNTMAGNLTGQPSLTIPVGLVPPMKADILSPEDENIRLPVGMLIVGKLFDDATVLQMGDAWEQAFDWKKNVVAN